MTADTAAARPFNLPGPRRLDQVRWIDLTSFKDERGTLSAIESGDGRTGGGGAAVLPFPIRRTYLLHHITGERGGHAHRDTHQVILAAAGDFDLALGDGDREQVFRLDRPDRGLLFGPMLYIRMPRFSADCCALVLASTHYDGARSIRSWAEYLAEVSG